MPSDAFLLSWISLVLSKLCHVSSLPALGTDGQDLFLAAVIERSFGIRKPLHVIYSSSSYPSTHITSSQFFY